MGGGFGDAEEAFAEVRLGGYPAEAAARGDGFGEGVEADDAALVVDGEVGGDEGVEEFVAGGFLGDWDGGGGVCGGELQVPVWVVFDYDDVEFYAYFVDILAALDAE